MDISLNNSFLSMKLLRHKVRIRIKGIVSQIFRMGPSFYFRKFRKKKVKKYSKSFPFFLIKQVPSALESFTLTCFFFKDVTSKSG